MSWRSKYSTVSKEERYSIKPTLVKNGKVAKMGEVRKSWHPSKKLVVRVKSRNSEAFVHFGDVQYEDYTEHKDKARRNSYLLRSKGIRNGNGKLSWKDPFSPSYYSVRILW